MACAELEELAADTRKIARLLRRIRKKWKYRSTHIFDGGATNEEIEQVLDPQIEALEKQLRKAGYFGHCGDGFLGICR